MNLVLSDAAQLLTVVAILGAAVVYGTDVFCAVVQRPALALVDDRALIAVMGSVHRFGDRRMPIPGAIGTVAALIGAIAYAVAGQWVAASAAGIATAALLVWLVVYLRISAPLNRTMTEAAATGATPSNARALQHDWDRVITLRAVLQGLALAALLGSLLA